VAVRRFSICLSLLAALLFQAGVAAHASGKTGSSTHGKKTTKKSAQAGRKLHRAFVASADLKPMAQQLLQDRTPQAYAGVEKYARRHQKDDAAALAWLALGYAHLLDKDYAKARDSLSHAEPLSPVLGDYLDFLLASAWQGEGNNQEVIKTLEGFEGKYPDSLNQHDVVLLYANALVADQKPQQAIAYLEKHRTPVSADVELALASAYQAGGLKQKAQDVLRRIYFEMPTSDQADAALLALKGMGETEPQGSFDQRCIRAQLLIKAHRYQDAVHDLGPLIDTAPPEKQLNMRLDLGAALYHIRKKDDAQKLFEAVLQDPKAGTEAKAQSLYYLAEIARDQDDRTKHDDLVSQLRALAPGGHWFQRALLSSGNMYLLKNEFDTGAQYYSEIYRRWHKAGLAPYAHWKTAWLNYRLGRKDEAARLFEEQLELYPSSSEVPAAIYWRGRIAEEDNDKPLARAYYQKVSENFRYFYYANLSRDRLSKLGVEDIGDPTALEKLPRPSPVTVKWDPPGDNVRLQKAGLLANGALYDFAAKELQAAAAGSPAWLAMALAALYGDSGNYINAIETLKRAVPGYFSVALNQIPQPIWQGLFPRPYWEELRRDSLANHLDPYLVAALIRQESEFNPQAVSPANAMGLMQLLPSVGKRLARAMKIARFSSDQLLTPETNLRLGTRYFKQMVDYYGGQVEYALAAYNAGTDRVDDWRKSGNFKSMDEFVESIPFTETREYVQAIMRNAMLYRLLYPEKPSTAQGQ
jgi:soluble lytic murein transglycosylase